MSSELAVAIDCAGICKRYRLGQARPYRSLREDVMALLSRPVWRAARAEHWALRDVSFSVPQGQALGLIGRNGAGKSTLVKILSRLTPPTTGRARVRGRVGTLLEVGAGFHPELTGRENIFLSGAVHGMTRREILAEFDAIVDFASMERFLDTPVKRYSTGMYMRLAFSVAAHLRSDVLLIDEVLAVGDAEFQAKVLGRMRDMAGHGRTVLFISHSMPAVNSLCSRVIVLDAGRIVCDDEPAAAIRHYLDERGEHVDAIRFDPVHASPRITRAAVLCGGAAARVAPMGTEITLAIDFAADDPIAHPRFGFILYDGTRQPITGANNRYQDTGGFDTPLRAGRIEVGLGQLPLMPGDYTFSLFLGDMGDDTHVLEFALPLRVIERDLWGLGLLPPARAPLWWPAKYRYYPRTEKEARA
jgi:lipopolysaccharide transport system ATP-binding protein